MSEWLKAMRVVHEARQYDLILERAREAAKAGTGGDLTTLTHLQIKQELTAAEARLLRTAAASRILELHAKKVEPFTDGSSNPRPEETLRAREEIAQLAAEIERADKRLNDFERVVAPLAGKGLWHEEATVRFKNAAGSPSQIANDNREFCDRHWITQDTLRKFIAKSRKK